LHLAQVIKKTAKFMAKSNKKKTSPRPRIICLIKDPENDIKSVDDKNADKVVGNIIERH
jgi:ParB family chromosome partitioning protein